MGDTLGEIMKQVIFSQFVQFPPLPIVPDLTDPAKYSGNSEPKFDMTNTTNLYITSAKDTNNGGRQGAWYLLPDKSSGKVEPLTEKDTVILYLHGNSHNRAQGHRVGLYKVLINMGYYVLAIDYRGFGDSSPVRLSESTVVEDARAALAWISDKLGEKVKVIVWGHSLGSAICSHMVADFDIETGGSSTVSGVVLESPFDTMLNEIMSFSFGKPLSYLTDVKGQLLKNDTMFESHKWLPAIKAPVLILHAEDDKIVPYVLGQNLFDAAKEAGKNNIRFIGFPAEEKFGHCNIYKSSILADTIRYFLDTDCANTE